MKLLTIANTVFDRVLEYLVYLAGVLIIFILLDMIVEVVLRYFFASSLRWVADVNSMLLLWIPFMAVALVLREEGHVKIDVLLVRLRPKARFLLDAITSVVVAIVCFALAWYSLRTSIEFFHLGLFTRRVIIIYTYIIISLVPIGSFLLSIEFLRRSYRNIKAYRGISAP